MRFEAANAEAKEESYFEANFEYGDDENILYSNLGKSLKLFSKAYKETTVFAEKAENGEVFDSEMAAEAFTELSLSYHFCQEFARLLQEDAQVRIVPGVSDRSIQHYINNILEKLFQYCADVDDTE